MSKKFLLHKYKCTGENFINQFKVGNCGQVKTLEEWILLCYDQRVLNIFINEWDLSASEIVDYLRKNTGKRLIKL